MQYWVWPDFWRRGWQALGFPVSHSLPTTPPPDPLHCGGLWAPLQWPAPVNPSPASTPSPVRVQLILNMIAALHSFSHINISCLSLLKRKFHDFKKLVVTKSVGSGINYVPVCVCILDQCDYTQWKRSAQKLQTAEIKQMSNVPVLKYNNNTV